MNKLMISDVKASKKTVAITGLSSYEDIANADFSALNKNDLISKIKQVQKLDANLIKFLNSQEENILRSMFVNSLTFQLEVQQRSETSETSQDFNASLAFMSKFRIDINSGGGIKRDWITLTLGNLKEMGIKVGDDFTQFCAEQGIDFGDGNKRSYFTYIERLMTFKPNIIENNIISQPKTKGKGGAIMLKDGKPIFYKSSVVFYPVESQEEFDVLYEKYKAQELKNAKDFEATSEIEEYPSISRNKDNTFNDEFQSFINKLFTTAHTEAFSKIEE